MPLYQIDYLKKTGALMKEVFKFKKYKSMHIAFTIFVVIFMSPFLLVGLLTTAAIAVLSFITNIMFVPLKHIHSLISCEAKEVKHATQFWIYVVSWPVFFFLYFVFSWIFAMIYLLYAFLSITMYIFTLGGFKFHLAPNADSDDIAINVKGKYFALPIVFICVASVLLITIFAFGVVMAVVEYQDEFLSALLWFAVFTVVYLLNAMLFSLIAFAPRCIDKGDDASTAEEAQIAENTETEPASADAILGECNVFEEIVESEINA